MVCIYCSGGTQVINSRLRKRRNTVWRRRRCLICATIFTTSESIELSQTILIQNKTAVEPFSRDRLFISIYESLKHRKSALLDASGLCDTIIQAILLKHENGSVQSSVIVAATLAVLERFDAAAATHYQAFHAMYSGPR